MTLKEHYGSLKGKTLAWVGDGNNVLHDLMIGSLKLGMNVRVATPKGYEPDTDVMATAESIANTEKVSLFRTTDPREAVRGAHVVVTDTWVSMGQEADAKQRKVDFAGYQVTDALMGLGAPGAVFMHCLPRKPEEVSDEVLQSASPDRMSFDVSSGVLLEAVAGVPRGREQNVDGDGSDARAARSALEDAIKI